MTILPKHALFKFTFDPKKSKNEDNEDSMSDDEPVENSSSQDAGWQPRLPSKKALDGLRARLRHIIHNFELLRAHKIRAVKLKELRKEHLSNLDE